MRTTISALTVLFIAPALVAGQNLAEACAHLSNITVGQWAQYQVKAPNMGTGTIRFAIVNSEERDGKTYYWHEMKMDGQMGNVIMQYLVPGYPYDDGEIAAAVMKMGDQPAMEMPAQTLALMQQQGGNPASQAVQACSSAEFVANESVTVPAGTFNAMHIRTSEDIVADMWVSTDIPFGLLRFAAAESQEIVLMDHGKDATSSIEGR